MKRASTQSVFTSFYFLYSALCVCVYLKWHKTKSMSISHFIRNKKTTTRKYKENYFMFVFSLLTRVLSGFFFYARIKYLNIRIAFAFFVVVIITTVGKIREFYVIVAGYGIADFSCRHRLCTWLCKVWVGFSWTCNAS